ncbi:FAD-dependent oxidoreductase [Aquamicrobium sp. LC103]|uniref:FAD-dependent oxidoreductase n=1 Tax=Aquamicrobium sp. LC103 TaxID=1120658 RepID=UPI0010C9DEB3|nr:FAD-dependent oxidoreductase [Aquamicrobium sp. LC103]TKT76188.1 FAD-dependent oxidoreductase [Aquamicrobium sp. LC103]
MHVTRDMIDECDVLIVGSGAAGLSTAVTAAFHGLKVVVAEKEPLIGGTSAWSGGWLWIPRNPLARRAGIVEDPESPREYLASELKNRIGDERIETFLENGPEMVDFFERNTAVEFIAGNAIPDFHATPGHARGGRSVSAAPYDGRKLGPWMEKLKPPLDVVSLAGMGIAGGADMAHFFKATRSLPSAFHVASRLARHFRDRLVHGRGMHLVNGNALVARLLRSALDLDVTILVSAPVVRLEERNGAVSGAILRQDGIERRITARRGVVLAAGGFPHDRRRIAAMFDHAPDGSGHYSAAPETNSGDGLALGEAAGGTVADDLVNAGAWAPVSLVPRKDGTAGRFPHLVERAKPGFIAVDSRGRRFVNEADSYHDFISALLEVTPAGTPPVAWLICDRRAQRRYGLGWSKPFPFPLGPYLRNGYLTEGRTPAELARKCGIDPDGLSATVEKFNRDAAKGEDPEFGRGRSPYNRVQGDGEHKPNASLAPLENGPFYAVRILPGSLGTFAGLRTDARARVLSAKGEPISGLFAVGNDMSSIFGGNYPSGGITLGPAMTFGYIAGRTLAGQPVSGPLQQKGTADETL